MEKNKKTSPFHLLWKDEIQTVYTKTGFTFNLTSVHQFNHYICTFTSKNNEEQILINLLEVKKVDSIKVPYIDKSNGKQMYYEVGDTLYLNCSVNHEVHSDINWKIPSNINDDRRINISSLGGKFGQTVYKTLTIKNLTLNDNGLYWCEVSDKQGHYNNESINITVFGPDTYFIKLSTKSDELSYQVDSFDQEIKFVVDFDAHPMPNFSWFNNTGNLIEYDSRGKFETGVIKSMKLYYVYLNIRDVSIYDYGNYTLVAENKKVKKSLSLFLNVTDKPTTKFERFKPFYMLNGDKTISCIVAANPEPIIVWEFKPCFTNECHFIEINETKRERKNFKFTSKVDISFKQSGFVRCSASNSLGSAYSQKIFTISDIENCFEIFHIDDEINFNRKTRAAQIAKHEKVSFKCGSCIGNFTQEVQWFLNGTEIETDDKYIIEYSNTQYSNRSSLTIMDSNENDNGIYSCRLLQIVGNGQGNKTTFKYFNLTVSDPMPPRIVHTNLNDSVEINIGNELELFCDFEGLPKPKIEWFWNNKNVIATSDKRIDFVDNDKRLIIRRTELQDEGTYSCKATNSQGEAFKEIELIFKNKTAIKYYIAVIVALIFLVVGACIAVVTKESKKKKLEKALREAGLANFEKGATENINPELGVDDQAELLPYDRKWEFPIEKLKLGKQLGSGAFGIVIKGEAKGILPDEETTTVAVKMVKRTADYNHIKALASELKIMVHLGKHLNVVNLLGACTENVAKRELLVIVEYCRFGNLHNYLYRHRENFIDQIDSKTGEIDFNIGQDILQRTYSLTSNKSNGVLKYAPLGFLRSSSSSSTSGTMRDSQILNTGKTESTLVSMAPTGEYTVLSSNNTQQPDWATYYRGDYKDVTVRPISTCDLIIWAFQVARGMDYLASRRVLHGDLAARNILLADDNVVKICDFGLAKNMYKNDNYKKNSDGPLPIKWLAIESIRDRVFSTESDVWSFGVVLWEFFSLARTPYPGMEADKQLYNKLVEGYRMERPLYANNAMYQMMLDCWSARPLARPSFEQLSNRLGLMLERSVRKHYIDLNDPYLEMNTRRIEEGRDDYLAMMNPPNFANLSSPQNYQNESNETGYLQMSPGVIFSPRPDSEKIFDFELKHRARSNSAEGSPRELTPMLSSRTPNSPCSLSSSPTARLNFSNPSYNIPPSIKEEKKRENIVLSPNNYVNMPQNKLEVKGHVPQENIRDVEDRNYINSSTRDWEGVIV